LKLARGGFHARPLDPGGQDEARYLEPLEDLVDANDTGEELLVNITALGPDRSSRSSTNMLLKLQPSS